LLLFEIAVDSLEENKIPPITRLSNVQLVSLQETESLKNVIFTEFISPSASGVHLMIN